MRFAGAAVDRKKASYRLRKRRRANNPAMPLPNRKSDAGSGTDGVNVMVESAQEVMYGPLVIEKDCPGKIVPPQ